MLWPASLAAQDAESGPTWWAVFTDEVETSNIAQYEAVAAEFRAMVDGHIPDGVNYFTLSGPEMGYTYAVPLASMAAFTEVGAKWEAMVDEIGREAFEAVNAKSTALVSHSTMNFYVERRDLSYYPDALEAASLDMPMRHFDWLYVEPGKESEFEAILKEWVDLYTEHGIETGWVANQAVTGNDLPAYVLINPADGMAAWATESEAVDAQLGEADDDLIQRSLALMRAYKPTNSTFRPELSALPKSE